MVFPRTQILNSDFDYSTEPRRIQVNLIGEELDSDLIEITKEKAKEYGLDQTEVVIHQSGNGGTDLNVLRSDILKDLYERNEQVIQDKDQRIAILENEVANYAQVRALGGEIAQEAKINHPNLRKFTLNRSLVTDLEKKKADTLLVAYAEFVPKVQRAERDKFIEWLKLRTKSDTVALILY